MDIRTRKLNPTVLSFVVAESQKIRKTGQRTGIAKITRSSFDEARGSFVVKIKATDAGHDLVAAIIRSYLEEFASRPGFPTRVDVLD